MLTPMVKTDPTKYYAGNRPVLNREFYTPERDMSIAQRGVHSFARYQIVDSSGGELPRYYDDYESGTLYTMKDRYIEDKPEIELYFVDDTPFTTTVQIVGKEDSAIIVQDLLPDQTVHFDSTPHYLIFPSDFFKIVTNLDVISGKFEGDFTFRKRGDSQGLALA